MLCVKNLDCQRGGRTLFRDLSFTASGGDLLWITGPNGSGKSTLLRLLAGLLPPGMGRIGWCGASIEIDPVAHRTRLHYVGYLDAVKPVLTVGEMLAYWQAMRGETVGDGALSAFGLQDLSDCPVRTLSAGQKKRLSLTRLTLNPALLWLLDEPSTALDRDGRDFLRTAMDRHRTAGGIVVAATHDTVADGREVRLA